MWIRIICFALTFRGSTHSQLIRLLLLQQSCNNLMCHWKVYKIYRFVLFTFFLQIHSIKWRPLAFIVAYAHIWCCCILIAFPKYDLLIRDQSSFYRFYDPSNNHLQKKIPSPFTSFSFRKGEYFGPEAILVKKMPVLKCYQLTLVALDINFTSCQFQTN